MVPGHVTGDRAKRVLKFTLPWSGPARIEMPYVSDVLHVDEQDGELRVWVLANTQAPRGIAHFYVALTGENLPSGPLGRHCGSVLADGGSFVAHVFERYQERPL